MQMPPPSARNDRLLGHIHPATTLKYTHLADATVHEVAEALAPILGGEG